MRLSLFMTENTTVKILACVHYVEIETKKVI